MQQLAPQEKDGKFISGLKMAGNGVAGWFSGISTLLVGAAALFTGAMAIACGGAAVAVVGAGLYYGATLAATAAMGGVAALGVSGLGGTILSVAAAAIAGSAGLILGGGAGGIVGFALGLGAKNAYETTLDTADGARSLAQATGRFFRQAVGKSVPAQLFTSQLVSPLLNSAIALSGLTLSDAFDAATTPKPAAQKPAAVKAKPSSSLTR